MSMVMLLPPSHNAKGDFEIMPIFLDLGRVVATAAVNRAIGPVLLIPLLHRHASGDWGDIDPSDWKTNDAAARDGDRVLSAYTVAGRKIWIITEADRASTTILFPSEY